MAAFEKGKEARKDGKSKHFNPYRNKGEPGDYTDWLKGWNS